MVSNNTITVMTIVTIFIFSTITGYFWSIKISEMD
jgi:uncharacterized protein YneF (UPF0154 family)